MTGIQSEDTDSVMDKPQMVLEWNFSLNRRKRVLHIRRHAKPEEVSA